MDLCETFSMTPFQSSLKKFQKLKQKILLARKKNIEKKNILKHLCLCIVKYLVSQDMMKI